MGRVRSGLRRLRARAADDIAPGEEGFTLVEMMVAITILALALMAVAYGLFGSMRGLQAARQRSTFLELANAEVEAMRALAYETVGASASDPLYAAAYPGGQFEGRDAVTQTPDGTALTVSTPAIRTAVTTSPIEGLSGGYTIHRRVTWTNPAGTDTPRRFKRLEVRIEWERRGGTPGSVEYSSVYYPGNLGPPEPAVSPTASFTVTPAIGITSTTFSFDASASVAPSPATLTLYEWDFGKGLGFTALGATPTQTYTTIGTYTITLRVTNSDGAVSDPVSKQILVGAPATFPPAAPNGPTASFTVGPASGPAPLEVTADATASTDPDGDPLVYTWDWGDGSPLGTGSGPSHSYAGTGSFTITLTVTDPSGQSSTATGSVTSSGTVCGVTNASFRNPASNVVQSELRLRPNRRLVDENFTFLVRTTIACTSVKFSIPADGAPFEVNLTSFSDAGSVRTFAGTGSSESKFATATPQNFNAIASNGVTTFPSSFPFTVVS